MTTTTTMNAEPALTTLQEETQLLATCTLFYNTVADDGDRHFYDCDLTTCDCAEWRTSHASA